MDECNHNWKPVRLVDPLKMTILYACTVCKEETSRDVTYEEYMQIMVDLWRNK